MPKKPCKYGRKKTGRKGCKKKPGAKRKTPARDSKGRFKKSR